MFRWTSLDIVAALQATGQPGVAVPTCSIRRGPHERDARAYMTVKLKY
jgi:hypothetical protein